MLLSLLSCLQRWIHATELTILLISSIKYSSQKKNKFCKIHPFTPSVSGFITRFGYTQGYWTHCIIKKEKRECIPHCGKYLGNEGKNWRRRFVHCGLKLSMEQLFFFCHRYYCKLVLQVLITEIEYLSVPSEHG